MVSVWLRRVLRVLCESRLQPQKVAGENTGARAPHIKHSWRIIADRRFPRSPSRNRIVMACSAYLALGMTSPVRRSSHARPKVTASFSISPLVTLSMRKLNNLARPTFYMSPTLLRRGRLEHSWTV
jgi:hypothetical protein